MTIYVGRWDLLPEDFEGINGLYDASEKEIREEVYRQDALCVDEMDDQYDHIGIYTVEEFEEEFNANEGALNGGKYWIKFFQDGKNLVGQFNKEKGYLEEDDWDEEEEDDGEAEIWPDDEL